jgi:uncharacterized damage-inducible protein DinB
MDQNEVTDRFRYLYWIRDRILAEAAKLPERFADPTPVAFRDFRGTLVHELDVERSWRLRLQGTPRDVWDVTLQPADYPDLSTLAEHWRRDEADTMAWLAGLNDADVMAPVTVNDLEGFALATYLEHIVMHGIESLSGAAILLHRRGQSVGDVGYLDYIDATVGRPPAS